ncbi:MAG: SDR family oxidoreductase [Ectothiorhodospiraceae bacterium]|nr:SDR family oxidoreductase [Ectothiorhodospiraceae bacterium]
MEIDLKGKRAIITAAAAGIGRETAELFSRAGAKVFMCDIDADGVERARTEIPNLDGMVADVSDPAALATLFERADAFLGGLDIMVNNAGSSGPTAPIHEVELDAWRACLDINLTSAFLCTQHAVPRLRKSGGGSIVNLSSAAGKFGFKFRSPYVSAKWAIVGLTRTTALEYGPDGIRCNCIQPGPVEGDRIDRVIKGQAATRGISENQMRDEMVSITSLRQFVSARDIASMILYLCSPVGSRITGQAISIDSGLEGLG